MTTPRAFALDVERWVKKAKAAPDAFLRAFLSELAKEVIIRTPVDTGFLRGSWFLSNQPSGANNGGLDTAGTFVAAKIGVQAAQQRVGGKVYLLNSASYAATVEYGTATRPPRNFVRGTVAVAPSIAKRVLADIRRAA